MFRWRMTGLFSYNRHIDSEGGASEIKITSWVSILTPRTAPNLSVSLNLVIKIAPPGIRGHVTSWVDWPAKMERYDWMEKEKEYFDQSSICTYCHYYSGQWTNKPKHVILRGSHCMGSVLHTTQSKHPQAVIKLHLISRNSVSLLFCKILSWKFECLS